MLLLKPISLSSPEIRNKRKIYKVAHPNLKMADEKLILQKLEKIEKEVSQIKEDMVDRDSIMTEEDYLALLEYRKEKAAGKLISHKQIKKEFGLHNV